jgi:hypothetical protein
MSYLRNKGIRENLLSNVNSNRGHDDDKWNVSLGHPKERRQDSFQGLFRKANGSDGPQNCELAFARCKNYDVG